LNRAAKFFQRGVEFAHETQDQAETEPRLHALRAFLDDAAEYLPRLFVLAFIFEGRSSLKPFLLAFRWGAFDHLRPPRAQDESGCATRASGYSSFSPTTG
jgi:hypothetical protein